MNTDEAAGRGCAVVHQTEDFLADVCAQFAEPTNAEPGAPVVAVAQAAVYYALGRRLDSPVIVSSLCEGLLALARARARQATALGALQRAHTRMSQAAFYLPRHLTEPKSEIES